MIKTTIDWNPETYARFRGFRLRPAMDLLAQVPDLPEGDIIDLGCGSGAVGPALAARFPGRNIIGIDSSPAMLAQAERVGGYAKLTRADANLWRPARAPALIFSNALCHWLDDHHILFPRLVECLASGGSLAVQMPDQYNAPSHALLRMIAAREFPDLFDFSDWRSPVHTTSDYARILDQLGVVTLWRTEYLQRLDAVETGHPVRHFTVATAMRPFLEKLDPAQQARLIAGYDTALATAYPLHADGAASLVFSRLFFVLTR